MLQAMHGPRAVLRWIPNAAKHWTDNQHLRTFKCDQKVCNHRHSSSHPFNDKPLLPSRRPTPLDKRILLWARRYKSFDDIPEVVSFQMINTAKNRLRVKIAYIMMVLTIIGCFIMITSGKKAFARQESLAQLSRIKIDRWREEGKTKRQTQAK